MQVVGIVFRQFDGSGLGAVLWRVPDFMSGIKLQNKLDTNEVARNAEEPRIGGCALRA